MYRGVGVTVSPQFWKNIEHVSFHVYGPVSFRPRLKLFHATVSPTAMFGLASLPLTQRFLHKLDVVQRRMLRSIIGWARIPSEPVIVSAACECEEPGGKEHIGDLVINAQRYHEIVPLCYHRSPHIWQHKISLHKHSVTGPSASPTLRRVPKFLTARYTQSIRQNLVQTIFRVHSLDQHPRTQANRLVHHPTMSQ